LKEFTFFTSDPVQNYDFENTSPQNFHAGTGAGQEAAGKMYMVIGGFIV
jgi:hypothetical protein